MREEAWDAYLAWNVAVADTVYTEDKSGTPAYLDMDDDVLLTIGDAVESDAKTPEEVVDHLLEAVRPTVRLLGGLSPFSRHASETEKWRRRRQRGESGPDEPPPALALLCVFSLAAERMGIDAKYASHAYYPRLHDLLRSHDVAALVEADYRQRSTALWGALNQWLTSLDGARGLPTAYALTFPFVGLATSQALVRAADRKKLPELFSLFGLAPGSQLPPVDMVRLLEAWFAQETCNASQHLQRAFSKASAKERIAEVVALELEAWDGTQPDGNQAQVRPACQLMIGLRDFPSPRVEIGLSVRLQTTSGPTELVLESAEGEPRISFTSDVSGWLRSQRLPGIDVGTLLSGVLDVRDPATSQRSRRSPRSVVPLRRDELMGTFTEAERVQLGEDMLVLVRQSGDLPERVRNFLTSVARPGFDQVSDVPGLPTGWVLFRDVQVLGFAQAPDALNALVPLASAHLAFAEGLRLPGKIRRFSSLKPPEITAVIQEPSGVRVELVWQDDESEVLGTWESDDPAIVVPLDTLGLGDGDYLAKLYQAGSANPVQQSSLRLRSGAMPDAVSWARSPRLVYPAQGLGALSATDLASLSDDEPYVDGAFASALGEAPGSDGVLARAPWWVSAKPQQAKQHAAKVAAPDPKSCMITGAHHIQLPPVTRGKPKVSVIEGTCIHCGLVKRYPAWAKRVAVAKSAPMVVDVRAVAPVRKDKPTWDVAMDALVHVGGGPISALERVALQLEGTSLFVDEFLRGMEGLGHLQVRRDPIDLRPVDFEYSPAYVSRMPDGRWTVVGAWDRPALASLSDNVQKAGGTMKFLQHFDGGPTSAFISGLGATALEAVIADVSDGIGVAPNAPAEILSVAAGLGDIREALPRVMTPVGARVEQFDLDSASWVRTDSAERPGAYRLQASFLTLYLHRTDSEVAEGTAVRATAQLVKHLEGLRTSRSLIAYDEALSELSVPLGADLPGLLGRAAILCSGRLPYPKQAERSLVYRGVPLDIALQISARLLTSGVT